MGGADRRLAEYTCCTDPAATQASYRPFDEARLAVIERKGALQLWIGRGFNFGKSGIVEALPPFASGYVLCALQNF